jgi:Protein of unknown function (DUF1207)
MLRSRDRMTKTTVPIVLVWLAALSMPTQAAGRAQAGATRAYEAQILPSGLMYRSYLAGPKEPRIGAQWLRQSGTGWKAETAIGVRVPMWRYGTADPRHPEGWQVDGEAGVFTRIDIGTGTNVDALDFRVGLLLTRREGRTAFKGGYYHISNHVGDEYLARHPGFQVIEYVRDSLVAGVTRDLTEAISIYGEVAYSYRTQGGAEPFEFQFGAQYNPEPVDSWWGRPFWGVNAHLRQEFGFGGSFNAVGGVQWRGLESLHAFRLGLQHYRGKSLQYSFFDQHEEWTGGGFWLDF